ncbi:glycosyltransferase family 4 protein [Jannaschia sp. Os4]|uniref:glycosyltransferase family 4 protein n=1 Tax=Jannaschia sp. Os4 TaxID=2807617 RepID=UPI0019396176|nr:glycosyltransferase family 4 protein [Jannaschia sp. Os4]MBM2576304.1 glycosyltransferase family 4 protein [Jannaschia sp. Os4]
MNSSYRVPSAATSHASVRVLQFIETSTPPQVVFRNPDVPIYTVADLPREAQLAKVFDMIADWRPDIVHTFSTRMAEMAYRHRMLSDERPRWVMDVRTPRLSDVPIDPAEQASARRMIAYWDALCTHVSDSLPTHFGPGDLPHVVVPPGLDAGLAREGAARRLLPLRRFVYVGSLNPRRQLEGLIEAFGALVAASDVPVSLDVFGAGPADYVATLERLAQERAGDRIRFLGLVPQRRLMGRMGQYQGALCYVPGGQYETAPALKLLEAGASGLRIFASDTEGLRRSAADSGIAATFFANDPASFRATVLPQVDTVADPQVRERNFEAARRLDWGTIVAERYLPLYRSLLDEGTKEDRHVRG